MERIRDLRRASTCGVNGFPRRRQRMDVLGDSAEEDVRMELQGTTRLKDGERLHKKEFQKRRRVDRLAAAMQHRNDGGGESYKENEIIIDSSDDGSYEEHRGMDQLSTMNRRGVRNLRSSSVVKVAADEIFGVPIPRRARSITAKKLHEHWNSGGGRSCGDLSSRRFPPAPVSLIDTDGVSPSSFSGSMKKKSSPVIQDDIEIEVAEALFDLMKQSRSSKESADTDGGELKILKAEGSGGGANNNAFAVQSELPKEASAEAAVINEMDKESGEAVKREKFPVNTVHDLVGGVDGFLNKGEMGSPKESESQSRVKVNACDNQYPTKTKADDYAASEVWSKNEAKLTIDLMALPEETASVDTVIHPEALTKEVRKIETALEDVDNLEKNRRDTAGVSECTTQQLQGLKGQKNQSTSLFPFPFSMSSRWPAILPHKCCITPPQTVPPIEGNARSSTVTGLPQFKFSQPQSKRCATHQNIAKNIAHHQKLIKKHLLSEPAETSPGTKPLNLQSTLPPQSFNFGIGKDKNQAPATNFSHGSSFIVPFGHPQNSMMVAAGPSQPASAVGSTASLSSSIPTGKPSVNLSLPVSFNHPVFPSKETAPPYMAVLPNNGCPIPVPPNFPMPSLKEGSLAASFNSSFYTSPEFSIYSSKQQLPLPYAPLQSSSQNTTEFCDPSRQQKTSKISDNKFRPSGAPCLPHPFLLTHSSTKPDTQNSRQSSGGVLVSDGLASQPMNFAAIPPFSSIGGGDHHPPQAFPSNYASTSAFNFSSSLKDFQSSEGKCISSDEQSFNLPRSDCASRIFNGLTPAINVPTSATIPDLHQHLIQLQKKHQVNASAPKTIIPGSFLPKWEILPRTTGPEGHITHTNSLALPGQQTDSYVSKTVNKGAAAVQENGIGQKSSPICRRNVPSILSTRPSQLSELKY